MTDATAEAPKRGKNNPSYHVFKETSAPTAWEQITDNAVLAQSRKGALLAATQGQPNGRYMVIRADEIAVLTPTVETKAVVSW